MFAQMGWESPVAQNVHLQSCSVAWLRQSAGFTAAARRVSARASLEPRKSLWALLGQQPGDCWAVPAAAARAQRELVQGAVKAPRNWQRKF